MNGLKLFLLTAIFIATAFTISCGEHGFLDDILSGGDSSSSEGSGGGTSSPSNGPTIFVVGSCMEVWEGDTVCSEVLSTYIDGSYFARQTCEEEGGTWNATACPDNCVEAVSYASEGLIFYECGGSL